MITLNTLIDSYPWLAPVQQRWQSLGQRLGHAYLFSGPAGIAMEQFIQQIALEQLTGNRHFLPAHSQTEISELNALEQHPDGYVLQPLPDKKEISVEQVRHLVDRLHETSHQGGFKVCWIKGVESFNTSAFNALLKSLEEPAEKTLFLLSTQQIGQLPATIKSRCQLLSLHTPPLSAAMQWLQQQMPEADQRLVKRALRLNWGAPLYALQWLQTGGIEQDNQWQTDLKQLQTNKKSVSKAVQAWLKWPRPELVFDYFYQWSVSAVRSVVYQQDLAQQPLETQQQVQNWLRFQQAVLQAQKNWQANANKELVLETLSLEWLELNTSQSYKSAFLNTALH